MWNANAGAENYKSWSAYRTRTDYERDENGEIVRDAQGRPNKIEVLDFDAGRFGTTVRATNRW